jgi:hypothetical protein
MVFEEAVVVVGAANDLGPQLGRRGAVNFRSTRSRVREAAPSAIVVRCLRPRSAPWSLSLASTVRSCSARLDWPSVELRPDPVRVIHPKFSRYTRKILPA